MLSRAGRSQRPSRHTAFRTRHRQRNQTVASSTHWSRFAITPPGRPYKANVGGSIPSAPTNPINHVHASQLSPSTAARSLRDFCGTFARGWRHPAGSGAPPRCSRSSRELSDGRGSPGDPRRTRLPRVGAVRGTPNSEMQEASDRCVNSLSGLAVVFGHGAPGIL